MTGKGIVASASLLALLLAPASLEAQGGPVTLEFSFSSPGARSMGLGGAFAAVADDATAAFANPAGLVQLIRPEVSIESRSWSYTTPFTAGGRLSGEPTGLGLDTTSGLRFEDSSVDLTGLSFLSFVYPHHNWSFALYRHRSANFEIGARADGLFSSLPGGGTARSAANRSVFDFEMMSTGLAAAYRLTDALSVGLGMSWLEGSLDSFDDYFAHIEAAMPDGPFGPNTLAPEALFLTSRLEVDDSALRPSLGILWQVTSRWDVGAFFRDGPRFEMRVINRTGPAFTLLPPGTTESFSTPIAFPDVYGVGIAYRSRSERATWSLEWDRVEYSVILESLNRDTSSLALDDADEWHAGFEYVLLRSTMSVALRAGVWLDPDHRIRGTGLVPESDANRRAGHDQVHLAFGLGLGFRLLQFDLGADFSERVDTLSVSVIYSF